MKNIILHATVLVLFILVMFFVRAEADDAISSGSRSTPKKVKKKNSKDWSKVDFSKLEEEWEEGDEDEELESDYTRTQRLLEKHQSRRKPIDPNDPKSMKAALKDMKAGGTPQSAQMIFVTLTERNTKGEEWDKEKTDLIAAKWTALVKTASLQADFYNLDNGSILVNIVKPWFFDGIMKFLAQQPETVKITKDQKDYYPKDILDDDDEL